MIVALRANDSSRKREMKVNFRHGGNFPINIPRSGLSFCRRQIIISPKANYHSAEGGFVPISSFPQTKNPTAIAVGFLSEQN